MFSRRPLTSLNRGRITSGGGPSTPATIFSGIIDYLDGDGAAGGGAPWVGSHTGHSWTAINTPTYNAELLNGHGGFTLSRPANQRFENTTIDLPVPPYTLILVAMSNVWNSGATMIGASTTTARIFHNSATPQIAQSNGLTVNSNGNLALSTWGVIVAEFQTAGTNSRLRAGGVDVSTGEAGVGNPGATLQIGAVSGAGHCSMSLAQLIFVNGIPSAGEYTAYAAYILARYGVTL